MKLWPAFLDRIYWRWYLKRHPRHTALPTIQFVYQGAFRRNQRALVEGITMSVEELRWLRAG